MIEFDKRIQDVDGVDLIAQVHDSLVVDSSKEHAVWAYRNVVECMDAVTETFEHYFGHKITVKLGADATLGDSYYSQADIIETAAEATKEKYYFNLETNEFIDQRK